MFTTIIDTEKLIELKFEHLLRDHPITALLAIFLGMPIVALAVLSVCTAITILPIALFMGWL
ncbi:MAG: hypothetical protein RR162_04840 [Oscillospiraceae bacterium]